MGWHKYGAKKVVDDGHTFASKSEHKRYCELKLDQKSGKIKELELQPKFPCVVNDKKICTYIADFRYWDNDLNYRVVEDVKGMRPIFGVTVCMA